MFGDGGFVTALAYQRMLGVFGRRQTLVAWLVALTSASELLSLSAS